jgi:PAS domain S-box-containing protein
VHLGIVSLRGLDCTIYIGYNYDGPPGQCPRTTEITMGLELRKTGIRLVGDAPWGTHFCHFYETKEDLLDILASYFKAGLENNELCVCVVSDPFTEEEFREGLRRAVPHLDQYEAERSLEILMASEWYLEGGSFDLHRVTRGWNTKLGQALVRGYDGLRVSGNTAWLERKDWDDFREYERQINESITGQPMSVLCTYSLVASGAAEILDVAHNHQFAVAKRRGRWDVVETPELKQAKAEILTLNEELERRVIERTIELRVANEVLRNEIVERNAAEEKLKRSESQLAEAQRVAHVGYWERNIDSGEIAWSDETYRIFGLQPQDPIHDFLGMIHPEDRPLQVEATARTLRGESYDVEYRVVRPDGEVRLVHSRGETIRNEPGEPRRAFGTVQDVTQLKRAEEKLKATTEQLRALSARLQSAREEESIRIAREIHDELGSALARLKWDLEGIKKTFSEPGKRSKVPDLKKKLAAMLGLTDTTINTVRRIASDLRPSVLDILGSMAAIEWQARQFQDRTGIVVHCDSLLANVDLNQEQSTAVFRIFQEALTNILRHAQATRVDVTMVEEAGALVLTIRDNGRGITEDEKSGQVAIGLLGMRERAHLIGGEIDITGVEGEGTTVTVRIPIVRAGRPFEGGS